MDLTVVTLLPRRAPRDAHAMHRAIAATCTGERVLWAQPTPDRLVIAAPSVPDWGAIPGATSASLTRRTIPPGGAHVTWALIANPVKALSPRAEDGRPLRRGRRTALHGPDVEAWARRKLSVALDVDTVEGQRLAPANGRGITITRYALAGTGTVTDPDALADLFARGVGPGKAFGCGLLTVREAA